MDDASNRENTVVSITIFLKKTTSKLQVSEYLTINRFVANEAGKYKENSLNLSSHPSIPPPLLLSYIIMSLILNLLQFLWVILSNVI